MIGAFSFLRPCVLLGLPVFKPNGDTSTKQFRQVLLVCQVSVVCYD